MMPKSANNITSQVVSVVVYAEALYSTSMKDYHNMLFLRYPEDGILTKKNAVSSYMPYVLCVRGPITIRICIENKKKRPKMKTTMFTTWRYRIILLTIEKSSSVKEFIAW